MCDLNYNNGKFSELESRGYKVPGQLRKEGYKVVQFYNMNDGKQYRHAGYVFIKDKEITITYRGSRNGFDYRKDAEMILTSSDKLLPKGGKIHSGFYSLFKDSWSSVYEILKGHANDQQLEIKDFKINLTGHSMGGAIANIAALCLSVTEGAEDLHVATFASPRVFDSSAAEIYKERLGKKTIRVVNQSDFIPSLPFGSMGYKHVGEQLVITSHCSLQRAHLLDTYRNLIANIEPDQFKSDNSVSIYYYPSYLAAVLYNVFTAPSYLILNIHSNDDEQYFTQVKNKHKGASLSEMMKYSGSNNEQKVVIYEDYEPSENGFITFHILRNAIGEKNLLMIPPTFNPNIEHRITRSLIDNLFAMIPSLHRYGRSKGLKVNLLDTAFFVNDDYYLSGDTISLRLLKTLVDNYPGNLALENANSQRVEDNALALTKESDIISGMERKPVRNKSMRSGFMNPIDNCPKSQFDNKIPSAIQIDEVGVGSTTTNDQSTSIINSNNTDNVQQESTIVAKESEELAAEISQGTSVEDGVTKNDNVQGASTTTTSSDGEDKLPPVQQAISIVSEELAIQTAQDTSIRDDITKNASLVASVSNDNNHSDSSKTQSNLNNGSVTAPYVQPTGPESVNKNSGKKDTQPKPTGVPLVASKDSKLLSDAQGNGEQSSYPGKNNSAPQNAKSKLPVIASSMLAITGVATGIAIAVYLEMLAVGIAVGACCLVIAAITYYCNSPANLLEDSNVEVVANQIPVENYNLR
ncbi:lipase family protein [Wolbachia endosymbiont (group A) of Lasioglossum malachurum]|uniref:lipase family protein n=1 Tax=Wolbachia endosymbiont (group A) of Lasioglossum malachurum TaxID=2954024 RepID=UPI0021F8EEE8|nr:lipase family protein [Wolbachia endosymbiont (group A) of Lasioglossum malachurum]